MPNLARKPEFEMTTNIFCGEWIAWLDAITHRSFIQETGEIFLSKFASHAYERGINCSELSDITRTALRFMEKNEIEPLDIMYMPDSMYGGVSVYFAIDSNIEECQDHSWQMVHAIVVQHNDSLSDLITFDFIPYETHADASKTA